MQQQTKEKQSGERDSYVQWVEVVQKRDGLSSTIYGVDLCQCKRLEECEQECVKGCQRHCEARSITILITKLPEVINFACITQITQTMRAPHRSFINSITY